VDEREIMGHFKEKFRVILNIRYEASPGKFVLCWENKSRDIAGECTFTIER
jgi:hypothetical protein